MKVAILNVGGALSSYIEVSGKKVVIDLGSGNDFSPVNDFLVPLFKKKSYEKRNNKYLIDQVILSHPHKDHISDLAEFDKHFFMNLYTTPNDLSKESEKRKNVNWSMVDDSQSDEVKKLRELYKGRQLPLRVCDNSMTIGYIYPLDVEENKTLASESYTNNISIAVFIHSNYRIFFAADLQKEGMQYMLDTNSEILKPIKQGVDFLVCPHHGLKSSFSTYLFSNMKNGKTKKLNIVSEKTTHGKEDKRQVDTRYSSTDYCEGDNNLSTDSETVCQRKTSNGHIFIDENGKITIYEDIKDLIDRF